MHTRHSERRCERLVRPYASISSPTTISATYRTYSRPVSHRRQDIHTRHEPHADFEICVFFFSSRRRHTRFDCDWSSDVCSSDLYGLRGLNYYQIELTGPERDLHSGVYGGAVPNPLTILTELFAKLHDKNFRVTVPGFYDQVAKVSNAERKSLNALPWKKKDFEKAVGAPGYFGETGFTTVERLWIGPTFELNGVWGGYQGEGAKTVIPSKAFAKFSTRLVPNQVPHKIAKLVEKHIRKLLPKTVHCKIEVLSMGKPWVASYHDPIFKKAQTALEKGFGKKAVFIREGGSIPFVTQMHDTFKVPCVLIGFGLPDENAHAPDEHIALENYFGATRPTPPFNADLPKRKDPPGFQGPPVSSLPINERIRQKPPFRPPGGAPEIGLTGFVAVVSTPPPENLHFSGFFAIFPCVPPFPWL